MVDGTGTATTGDEPDTHESPSEGPAPGRRPRPAGPPMAVVIPWVIAAIAIATAVGLFLQQRGDGAASEDVAAAEEAAGAFALRLTTWDATDGMGDTREALRAASTESFAAEVDELFGGSDDLAGLEELGARSESEIVDVLVSSVEDDEAEALAVIIQQVTTEVTEGAEVSERYARITLARGEDGWRVQDLELAVDLLQEAAERIPGEELPGLDLDLDDAPAEDAPAEEGS